MPETFWNRCKNLFSHPLDHPKEAPVEQPNPILSVLSNLEVLRQKAFQRDESSMRAKMHESALEEERREAKAHQQEMLEDILQLHQTLKTGFGESDLNSLAEQLRAQIGFFSGRKTESLADQGLLAILHSVHQKSLVYGWEQLNARLADAHLKWPLPLGMSPSSTAEEIQAKSELNVEKLRHEFESLPGLLLANLLLGVIPVWHAVYPERHSSVWTDSVYQAVAGALAVRHILDTIALANDNIETLRWAISSRLTTELQVVEDRLTNGVGSLAEARSLSDQAVGITQTVANEEFWKLVRTLHPEDSLAQAG